jgi:hypothetical protein
VFLISSAKIWADGQKPAIPSGDLKPAPSIAQPVQPAPVVSSSAAFQLNWLSLNGGGAINASSTNYKLGLSVGQSVAGAATSTNYQMGIGFWYGASAAPACANIVGDLNGDAVYTSSDVVLITNCAFLGAGSCDLCFSDVNCDGFLTSSDVVLEINRAFLGTTAPPWCGQ